jgi:hypothetical protein
MDQSHSWETDRSSVCQEIPTFYRTRRFITPFTSQPPVRIVSQINPVNASPSRFLKIHFKIVLPSTPKSFKRFFLSDLPTKTLVHLSTHPIRATNLTHLILLELLTRIIRMYDEEYRSWSSSLCSFLHYSTTSSLWGPNMLLNTLFSKHSKSTFLLQWERLRFRPIQNNRQRYSTEYRYLEIRPVWLM